MLKSENPKNAARVLRIFQAQCHPDVTDTYDVCFEHGQLWIIGTRGDIYSVVDAEGHGSVDGYDFEQVSEPDEEEDDPEESTP
jgi:hypothetical protein